MLAELWWTYRCTYQQFKAMCPMKWSRLYRHSSTSATLSDVMYMILKASKLYKMHSIGSTSTAKYSKQPGVHPNSFDLPQSHVAVYYMQLIWAFGAPNGLCSSITESKHIVAVKEPWRRSSRWHALRQMLITNSRLDKLAAAWADFTSRGMLEGTVLDDVFNQIGKSDSILFLYWMLIILD